MLKTKEHLVLAILNRHCVDVFSIGLNSWMKSPPYVSLREQIYEFSGTPATTDIRNLYMGKVFRSKSQYPVRCFNF